MLSESKLNNNFHKVSNEENNIVIIPSGYVMGKPPEKVFNEQLQLDRLKGDKVSVTLPYDDNIYNGKFSKISWKTEISHSPKERAEMIYEAISTQNADGSYKYNNIYFTGGSNTEDVIFELDKLCKERGALPKRKDSLKTYGFSDATQLHHYLGQRAISTPVYYSKNIYALIDDLAQKNNNESTFELKPVNNIAESMDNIHGYLQPGNQTQVEDKPTHQTSFFEDNYNFLVVEFDRVDAAKAFLETSKKFDDKKIALLLSKDTNVEAVQYLAEHSAFPIFNGMPVGHGYDLPEGYGNCQKNGEAIPLFTNALLEKTDKGYALSVTNVASDNVIKLALNDYRHPVKTNGGNETTAILSHINGSSGAVFENLDNIQVGVSNLTIKIPEKEKGDVVQAMEMSIKKLYDKGIVSPNNLDTIAFNIDNVVADENTLANIETRLIDLKDRYLPNLSAINFNNESIWKQFNLQDHLATLGNKYLQDFPEKEQIQSRISHEEGRNNSVYDLKDLIWWPDKEDLAKKCPAECQNQENIGKIKQILSDFSNADTPIAQELKGILDNTDFVIGIRPREQQPDPNANAVFKREVGGEKNKAVLMVSEVLFDEKNKDILPGLLAHEMGHFIDFYNRPYGNYAKLKWQEGAETFADTIGVLIAKGAGYDCNGWANFLAAESAKGNHPSHTHTGKHRANNMYAVSEAYDRKLSHQQGQEKVNVAFEKTQALRQKISENKFPSKTIAELRGISSATKVPYKPQTTTINPNTLCLYQSKKIKS